MNLFNTIICLVLVIVNIISSFSRVLMFERLTVQHKVLEGSPVSLRCVSQKMENVRIFQRYISAEGEEVEILLVRDLALSEGHHGNLFSYNYYWSTNLGYHDLIINNVDRSFLRHLFVCVTTQTFTPYKLRISDVFYHPVLPVELHVTGDDNIFFTEEIGKPFEIYCSTETGNPPVNIKITNSIANSSDEDSVQTSQNTTHSTVHFSESVKTSLNNSYFYCNITQSFPQDMDIQDYAVSCAFGPLLIFDDLHVFGLDRAEHFKKGDVVNFTCASNIKSAEFEWTEIYISDQISVRNLSGLDKSVGLYLSFYIEDIKDTLNVSMISASCKVSLKGRHAFKTFVAYSTISATEKVSETTTTTVITPINLPYTVETKLEKSQVAHILSPFHGTSFLRTIIVGASGFIFLNVLLFLTVLLIRRKRQANRERDSSHFRVKKEQIGAPIECQRGDKIPEEISDDLSNAYSKQVYPNGLSNENYEKYCSTTNGFPTSTPPSQWLDEVSLYVDTTDLREARKSPKCFRSETYEGKYECKIANRMYGDDCRIAWPNSSCYSTRVHSDATVLHNSTNASANENDERFVFPNITEAEYSIYSEIR